MERRKGGYQLYTDDYRMNDENVKDYQDHEQIIKIIKQRFMTYGYKRIKTSAFEQYDLYSKVTSAINQNEMIKVIDHTGEVLVLRPDVTIPITSQLAQDSRGLASERRYFYVQDVYRQKVDKDESIEATQAGVEYFGKSTPEVDAEVIALACQTLKDLGLNDVKIEIGHAGFFQELINNMDLTANQLNELKAMIQAKNGIDIRPFLEKLNIVEEVITALERIPFLYGNPVEVSDRAKEITVTKKMNEKLEHLIRVFEIVDMYGLSEHIVMDLGLINQMGYYSDIIFQGFVGELGKPVIMGGRYNHLADTFGASIPAIGFACQVDALVKATRNGEESVPIPIDFEIRYNQDCMQEKIKIENALRELLYSVVSYSEDKKLNKQGSVYQIIVEKEQNTIHFKDQTNYFSDINDLLNQIKGGI